MNKLNLVILDDNLVVTSPLTKYLNKRFGERINLSTFIDGNECMRNIDHNSHVLILNYAMKGEDLGAHNRGEIFKKIKKLNPDGKVTMLTSKQNVFDAIEEIQKRVGGYIRKKERYLYDVLLLFDTIVFAPIHKRIVLPTRKFVKDYSVISYILMILIAFATVGLLVMTARLLIK